MAKGIEINGQMRGKRGGVVYYRAAGQQISRTRNFAPRNPQTAKQAVQRMVLATASKIAAALRPIVNHSTEGVQAGEPCVRAFQRRAMLHLRDLAAVYINEGGSVGVPANFAIKGAPVAGGADGLLLSVGSLRVPAYTIADGILSVQVDTPLSVNSAATYEQWLSRWGMKPGDQLTLVAYQFLQGSSAASYGDEINPVDQYRFARVVFKPSSDIDFSQPISVFGDGGRISDTLVERAEGQMPAGASADGQTTFDFTEFGSWDAAAVAVVISRKLDSGKFSYSSSRFVADRTTFDYNNAAPVFETYMAGAQDVNVGDVRYLQHAVAAPFQEAGA